MHSGAVTVTLTDVSSDVVRVVSSDGAELTAAPWSFPWQAVNRAKSPSFDLYDEAGNRTTLATDYIVDDDPPVIQSAVSMAPYMDSVLDDGSGWVGDAGTLTAAVRDASPLRYEWWVDGVLLSSGQYFYWRTTGMTARTANVEVKVWDAVGNFASHSYVVNIDNKPPALGNYTTYSRDVIIDNTLPTLRITKAPRNTSKPRKTTTITAAAGDRNGVARVQLLVNGKLVATDSKADYSFSLNPKKYGKTFTVQLRAYDKAGNVRYTGKLTYHR